MKKVASLLGLLALGFVWIARGPFIPPPTHPELRVAAETNGPGRLPRGSGSSISELVTMEPESDSRLLASAATAAAPPEKSPEKTAIAPSPVAPPAFELRVLDRETGIDLLAVDVTGLGRTPP